MNFESYCANCRKIRTAKDCTITTLDNNQRIVTGVCSGCGMKMAQFWPETGNGCDVYVRTSWLDLAHRKLDEAVLERLLALDLERVGEKEETLCSS